MLCVRSPSSKLLQIGQKLEKWQWRHNLLTWHHRQVLFVVVLFFLSRLVTGPSFMSMSSLVLELWQFSFIRDWPEIRKLDISPSEFCPISGDRRELVIPNLARMSQMKCYRILQNANYGIYRFWVIKGKPTGRVKLLPPLPPSHPPRLGLSLLFAL